MRSELSWTLYRTLRVDDPHVRTWYLNEAVQQKWRSRALERQIATLYYERLLASQDRAAVENETSAKISTLGGPAREFVRDAVLEFLGMPTQAPSSKAIWSRQS